MASASVSHLLVQTENFDRLVEFYTDVVGFNVSKRETFGEDRPLVVFEERMGVTELPEKRADAGQVLEHVAFQVEAFDALVDRLHEHDVPIDDGPKSTSYGTSVYFFDPDGNRIECHD
jgi:catechol 2,3-dioxygenase-like lactoylglutathione lyase family enzyme